MTIKWQGFLPRFWKEHQVELLLLIVCFCYRIFSVVVIGTAPDMEPGYVTLAKSLFNGNNGLKLYLSPAYAALLAGFHLLLPTWLSASQAVYVVFGTATTWLGYVLARELFDRTTARGTFLLLTFLPSIAAELPGYSHTPVVSWCFLATALVLGARSLHQRQSFTSAALIGILLLLAALVRGEYILYLPAILVATLPGDSGWPSRKTFLLQSTIILLVVAAGLSFSRAYLSGRSNETLGFLGSARYGYTTYMHTLSLRDAGVIQDDIALRLGAERFGTAEANQWSIARAMRKNPREAAKSLAFNAKELLKEAGSPLLFPALLYIFVGLGIFGSPWEPLWREHFLLMAIIPPCVLAILIFHFEMRYAVPIVLPLAIWAARGLHLPQTPHIVMVLVYAGLCLLSLLYVFHFRAVRPLEGPRIEMGMLLPCQFG